MKASHGLSTASHKLYFVCELCSIVKQCKATSNACVPCQLRFLTMELDACTGGIEQDEAAELERQYAEAAAQDQIALTSIKDRTSKERTKGLAVLHQKQLWEQNLEMRILLQRCLQAANRIPYGLSHTLAVSADSALAQGYATLVSSASQTIDELLELHSALVDQHPAAQQIASDVTKASSSKRSREEEDEEAESVSKWQRIDEEYRKLTPFRDASIDRWHRKTMLISGQQSSFSHANSKQCQVTCRHM